MSLISKAAALLEAATYADLNELPPLQRERFRLACAYWAERAKPRPSRLADAISQREARP